jgi:integrase
MVTPGQIINELPVGVFQTLQKIKPSGALQVRKQASTAVAFYWRFSIGTKSERVAIGLYDPSAAPKSLAATTKGFSVSAAVRAAETLALRHHQHRADGGHPALIAAERDAKRAAQAAHQQAGQHTLENLLNHYSAHLEQLGRTAHRETRSIFKLHVIQPWPKVAALPAKEVTGEQIADMMRLVTDAGKGRTANKLRSYVRAAYQTAKASRSKASIPLHFKAYNVSHNPAVDTDPDESQNRADKNPLTTDEMRSYWQIIKPMSGFKGAVLRLHLLTGGQRIEQLVRLRTCDIATDSIRLYDGKGRPGKPPRIHSVPLLPDTQTALQACEPKGEYALSTDGGDTHLAATTLSAWAVEAAVGIKEFRAKRIRSGVETLLASAEVSSEIRGRLQSHGVAGVQARHYDGYDYMKEKRRALETLLTLLEKKPKSSTKVRSSKQISAKSEEKH